MSIYEFIGTIVFLYAIANPIGVIPIFLNLAKNLSSGTVNKIIYISVFTVAAFLAGSVVLGDLVLQIFNVSIDDFRIAGGLLILYIAFNMFQAHFGDIMQTVDEKEEAEKYASQMAITPLAFPLLIGPAELSIMITYAGDMTNLVDRLALILAATLASLLIGLSLYIATPINRYMGRTGINIATRLMALLVAAIGINFIITGIKNSFGIAII